MKNETVTIQKTSKKLKFHIVLCWLGIIAAAFWALGIKANANLQDADGDYSKPLILFAVACVWGIITRIRIWWNHG